ncbi:GNAT family N-acetyltransferase [Vibrio parahaemolyticus]|nr:GNAT family N-acetyltransferase [Vibrio parahaemolyticus]MDF4513370.1 GNAT family N-acetyltransferase [Vibrio parahaemolyticus]MDF5080201.1 GNAT family N-acetyltransferase [Vibrio parahaemolyticus]MDF5101014.1 GNAT family N-acetyltransferase [Vibrio parahaemolyticus]MDF5259620.1 GNAT family N-acetyltransferase [Vibrio parahaemolyticus]
MISIEKYSVKREYEANLLSVKPEQSEFTVGNITEVVSSLKEYEHPHLIISNGEVAGFFLLDLSYAETYGFSNSKALGVRALLVDQRFQGQGVATKAINLLPSYVVNNYPDFQVLQLTVNCRNKAAYNCYCKCGFEDTGELYLGGPVGPQHVMQRKVA